MYNKLKNIISCYISFGSLNKYNPSFTPLCVYNYLKSSFDRIIVLLFKNMKIHYKSSFIYAKLTSLIGIFKN
jgi:hypothetical protein